jgi:hypothetical protein
MSEKPTHAVDYSPKQLALVKATCLYIATRLGDLMNDVVIIGGLAPSLLIAPDDLPEGVQMHPGTMDLDLGLALALLNEGRYRTLADRLRDAGFKQDRNEKGNPTLQRWKIESHKLVTIDFLIPPSQEGDRGGSLRHIESDFAAVIAPGLHLAFLDREKLHLSGETIFGERADRDVWVCGPGAYVVLKALAFDGRGDHKDAYDLFYVACYFGNGVKDVAARMKPLLVDGAALKALEVLRRDFLDHGAVGPRRVAEFISGGPNDVVQADVVGTISALLRSCAQG